MPAQPPVARLPAPAARTLALILALFALAPSASAQVDSIRAGSSVVTLRSIWSKVGPDDNTRSGVGIVVAALPDLDGDGRAEFGVGELGDQQWRIYGLDALGRARVLWQRRGASPKPLMSGHFHGDGRLTFGYPRELDTTIGTLHWLELLSVDSGRIAESPYATWHSLTARERLVAPRYSIADLDLDGADELIVAVPVTVRGGVRETNGEIWIYKGGADFQVDTPTVVIRDASDNGGTYDLHVGRIDEDEYPDLLCVTRVGARIRWGEPDVRALDRRVDREFGVVNRFLDLLDADGDRRADLLWYGAFLHLSSSGKDARTRSFDGNDVERHFVGRGSSTFVLGPLNDSANRYDMFGVPSSLGDNVDLIFSGAHGGPDHFYDATYSTAADGLGGGFAMRVSMPAGDIDGNGWRDFIAGNERFDFDRGIAVVIGGGPHIPRDSMPASLIRDLPSEGHRAAISVWPNPATEAVHIAWRGDLGRTPERFDVHDALGRLVARGDADHRRGEVQWHCAGRPAGVYLLTIFDARGEVIAVTAVSVR